MSSLPSQEAMDLVILSEPGPQLGPLPHMGRLTQGFQRAVEGLQQATIELANFANLPPIAQATTITPLLQQMQEQMQQQFAEMRADMQQMRVEMRQNHEQTLGQFAQVQQGMQQLRTDVTTGFPAM